jgi:MoaA/NifB/PqqE/SkfB family radical SAM enzyme
MSRIVFAIIGVTYRCNSKCTMCSIWQYPSLEEDEIDLPVLEKLPEIPVLNVTGGEPFMRDDLRDIIGVLKRKSRRIVISTNGILAERIISLARRHPELGFRISLEGLAKANQELRGIQDGFEKSLATLKELKSMGIKDVGMGITISDGNYTDILPLYELAKSLDLEFATAVVHNSYYFQKNDNRVENKDEVISEIRKLTAELLKSKRIKDWYRAYFNYGMIKYLEGKQRLLPCEMAFSSFYLDPYGEVRPCNAMEESMGSLKEKSFADIWNGDEAGRIRNLVKNCDKHCWMIGSVGEIMKKNIIPPTKWVMKAKFLHRGY